MLVLIVSNRFLMTHLTTEFPHQASPAEIVEAEGQARKSLAGGPSLSWYWTKLGGKGRLSLSANQQRALIRPVWRA